MSTYAHYPPLVPYNAGELVIGSPMLDPRIKAAYGAAKFAYQHRQAAGKAAKTIGSAYKRYVGKKRRKMNNGTRKNITHIGHDPMVTDAKENAFTITEATIATKNLYTQELTTLAQDPDNAINARQRGAINWKGFRVDLSIHNNLVTAPIYLNVAVVCPKGISTVSNTNFFRAHGVDRAQDFLATQHPLLHHFEAINGDNYVVLKHERHMIGPNTTAGIFTNQGPSNNYWVKSMWIPFKRQSRWDSDIATAPATGRVFLCFWVNALSSTGATASTDVGPYDLRVVQYFSEPRV